MIWCSIEHISPVNIASEVGSADIVRNFFMQLCLYFVF